MTKTLDFVFDFASPNAYLALRSLPPLLKRTRAVVNLRPALLGGIFKATNNQAPMIAFAAVKPKLAYEALEFRRFIEKHGLTRFRMNPHFPINSLLLMRGLVAAQAQGLADTYVDAVLRGMWEDERKMDDPEVLTTALNAAGLDAKAMLAASQTPEVKARLIEETDAAVARGVFGIPTFFVGDKMFFGKERLDQVEEALSAT